MVLALGTALSMALLSSAFGYAITRGPVVRRMLAFAPAMGVPDAGVRLLVHARRRGGGALPAVSTRAPPRPQRVLAEPVFAGGRSKPFAELTADEVRARADELKAATGWGPTAKVASVAMAWASWRA